MRVYPKALRFNSSNLNPMFPWKTGAQLVALNWQKLDMGTMLNEAMFSGSGGMVLKPSLLITDKNVYQKQHSNKISMFSLKIHIYSGYGLFPVDWLNSVEDDKINTYVKCILHITKESTELSGLPLVCKEKRRTKTRRGTSPDYEKETLLFSSIRCIVPELSFLRCFDNYLFHDGHSDLGSKRARFSLRIRMSEEELFLSFLFDTLFMLKHTKLRENSYIPIQLTLNYQIQSKV